VRKDSATSNRVPAFVEPMKAKLVDSIPPGDWYYEIKINGYRSSNKLSGKIGKGHPFVWNDSSRWKSAAQCETVFDLLVPWLSQLYDFGSQVCRFEPCREQCVDIRLLTSTKRRASKSQKTDYLPKFCHFGGEPPVGSVIPARRARKRLNRRPRIANNQHRGLAPSPVKERFKAIVELVAIASSLFALHRDLIAELEKLDPSPEQQAILARLKAPLAKHKAAFKEGVKDGFGIMARIDDSRGDPQK
jgi:hypothetical protein